jgi:hypothetical protein
MIACPQKYWSVAEVEDWAVFELPQRPRVTTYSYGLRQGSPIALSDRVCWQTKDGGISNMSVGSYLRGRCMWAPCRIDHRTRS